MKTRTDLDLYPQPPPNLVLACTSCPWWTDKHDLHAERRLATHTHSTHHRWPTRTEQTGRTIGWSR